MRRSGENARSTICQKPSFGQVGSGCCPLAGLALFWPMSRRDTGMIHSLIARWQQRSADATHGLSLEVDTDQP